MCKIKCMRILQHFVGYKTYKIIPKREHQTCKLWFEDHTNVLPDAPLLAGIPVLESYTGVTSLSFRSLPRCGLSAWSGVLK